MQIYWGAWPWGLEPNRIKRCGLGGGWQMGGSLIEIRAGTSPAREGRSNFSFSFSLPTWNEALPSSPSALTPTPGKSPESGEDSPRLKFWSSPWQRKGKEPWGRTSKAQDSQAGRGVQLSPFQTGLLGACSWWVKNYGSGSLPVAVLVFAKTHMCCNEKWGGRWRRIANFYLVLK